LSTLACSRLNKKETLVTITSGTELPVSSQTLLVATPRAALQPGLKKSADPTSDRSLHSPPENPPGAPHHKKARHFPLYSPCLSFRLDPSSESECDDTDASPRLFQDVGKGVWSWFCQEDTLPEAWFHAAPPDDLPPPPRHSTFKNIRLHNQIQRVCFPETAMPLRAVAKPSSAGGPLDALLLAAFVFVPRAGALPLRDVVLARLAEPEVRTESKALHSPTTPRLVAPPPPVDERDAADSVDAYAISWYASTSRVGLG